MSETVMYEGKIEKVDLTGTTLHDKIHELCELSGGNWYNEFYKDAQEEMYYEMIVECTENYTYIDGDIYKYTKEAKDLDYDIFDAKRQEDGTIKYTVRYYNGGCGFTEALEESLKRMK